MKKEIINYTNWLLKQNLIIVKCIDGALFKDSTIGGKYYTAEELYNKYITEDELH